MKTEQIEVTLRMPDQPQEQTFEVMRMLDDDGTEKIWEIRSYLDDRYPPRTFQTKEEYEACTDELSELFDFPAWEDIAKPGAGATLSALGSELSFNELQYWLLDVLYEMRAHQDGIEPVGKVQVEDNPSSSDDAIVFSPTMVGVLFKAPKTVLEVVYTPELQKSGDPMTILRSVMCIAESHGQKPEQVSFNVPVIWNVTRNCPHIFQRGDKCKVRFARGTTGGKVCIRQEWVTDWHTLPFNQIWNLQIGEKRELPF